ncbi:hypothetical protein D3C79_880480 [compost metagenome]
MLLPAHRLDHPLPKHLGGIAQHGDLQVVAGLKMGEQATLGHLAQAGEGADGQALQPLLAGLLEGGLQNVLAGQTALAHRRLLTVACSIKYDRTICRVTNRRKALGRSGFVVHQP